MPISFGPFAFDERNGLLSNAGTEIPLPPRVLGVLGLLVARPGEVVSRQELLDQVWKDAYVTDTSLAEAISYLRQSLGDDPQNPRYIQTVHRRGYRFVAEVRQPESERRRAESAETDGRRSAGATSGGRTAELGPSIARDLAPWSVAVVCAALAMAALWALVRGPASDVPPIARFEFRPPAGSWFDRRAAALAISRDGTTLAWAACEAATSTCGLYTRRLDRLESSRVAGSEGAEAPFFSPDGRWVGFFADGKLKKVALAGGAPIALADAPDAGGASWNDDGRIVFSGQPAGGLSVASDQGGEVTPLTKPRLARGELRHAWPGWLPDGGVVFTVITSPADGAAGELAVLDPTTGMADSGSWRILRGGVTRAVPAGPGYVLVASGGDLQALTFDDRTRTLTGAADSVMANLATANGIAQFAVSGAGTLFALRAPVTPRTVAWADDLTRKITSVARLFDVVVSPDGKRAAGISIGAGTSDIWTVDLASDTPTRVTFGGVNVSPVWTPGGELLYAVRGKNGTFDIVRWPADAPNLFPRSVSRDGRVAAVVALPDGRTGISILSKNAPAEDIVDGPVNDTNPAFSPDGQWLAYETDASGQHEIVVRPWPSDVRSANPSPSALRPPLSASRLAGSRPSWSADGKTIYYVSSDRLMRVPFTGAAPAPDAAEVVFDRPDAHVLAITPAGRILVEQQPLTLDSAVVVLQWLRELRQKLPQPVSSPR